MTPERRRRIDNRSDAGLGLEPAERQAWRRVACGDDEPRAEVSRLSDQDERADRDGSLSPPELASRHLDATASGVLRVDRRRPGGTGPAEHDGAISVDEARRLGQYRLRRRLGAGGMGQVYLAEHLLLKRPCALKLIRPGIESGPKALEWFEREVRLTATLSHPDTVEIYDYGRTGDATWTSSRHKTRKCRSGLIESPSRPNVSRRRTVGSSISQS